MILFPPLPRTWVINDGAEIRPFRILPETTMRRDFTRLQPPSTTYFYICIYVYIATAFIAAYPTWGTDARSFSPSPLQLFLSVSSRENFPLQLDLFLPSPRCCSRKARHELTQKRTDRLSASVIYFANEPVHGGISCLRTNLYIVYIYIKYSIYIYRTVFSRPRGKKKGAPTPRIRKNYQKISKLGEIQGYKRVSTAISTGLSLSLSLVYHSWKGKGGRDACGQNRKNRNTGMSKGKEWTTTVFSTTFRIFFRLRASLRAYRLS